MQTTNRGGDVLASGGVRMDSAPGSGVSQEKWEQIFGKRMAAKKAKYVVSADGKLIEESR